MRRLKEVRIAALFVAGVVGLMAGPAVADYPERTITLVVPFSPGGSSDVVARTIQPKLSEVLGENVVVENRPGAGGNIAIDSVVRSDPDGYTAIITNIGTMTINPHIFKDVNFDPLVDLKPVTKLISLPSLFVVNKDLGVETLAEFVEFSKANPETGFASPGSTAPGRFYMELFAQENDLVLTPIPYSGGAGPALTAVMAGHVPAMFTNISSGIKQVNEGMVKALGVSTEERLASAPDIPTMIESGKSTFTASSWQGVHVPAGTPDDVVKVLFDALSETLADPGVREKLEANLSNVTLSESPQAFGNFVEAESKKWKAVVERSGATAD